jgi:hypothetical protein
VTIQAFKGFDKDLRCRSFQYEEGKTYTHDGPVSMCNSGFHAVTLPLAAFTFYAPGTSRYHKVTLDDVSDSTESDSKRVGGKITIGASLGIPGLVKAHVEAVWDLVKKPSEKTKATTGDYAHAATTGDSAHAATTGDYAHAATTGYSANAATTGYSANAATTGDSAHAATTGDSAHAATTGRYANAATTGYSANVRASVKDEGSIAAVLGQGAASGAVGCWLVLTERDDSWNIIGVQAVQVDGETVKADTFYTLRYGRLVEA